MSVSTSLVAELVAIRESEPRSRFGAGRIYDSPAEIVRQVINTSIKIEESLGSILTGVSWRRAIFMRIMHAALSVG